MIEMWIERDVTENISQKLLIKDIGQGEVELKTLCWSDWQNTLNNEGMREKELEKLMTGFRLIKFKMTVGNQNTHMEINMQQAA